MRARNEAACSRVKVAAGANDNAVTPSLMPSWAGASRAHRADGDRRRGSHVDAAGDRTAEAFRRQVSGQSASGYQW